MSDNKSFKYEIIEEEPLYKGFFGAVRFHLRHTLFKGGMSNQFGREVFMRTPAAGVLLYDEQQDKVVLIEQFRVGPMVAKDNAWMLEVVAGIAEPGEDPEEVATREAAEEAGCTVTKLIPISSYYPSPGACNEIIHLYCGFTDSTNAGGIHGLDEENEDIKVHVISSDEALNLLDQGVINNATTIISLQWLRTYRQKQHSA